MTQTSPIQSYRNSIKNCMVASSLSIGALALAQLPIIKAQLPIYMSAQVHQTWEEQAPKPMDGISVPYFTFDSNKCSAEGLDLEGFRDYLTPKDKPVFDNTGVQFGEARIMQAGPDQLVAFRITHECVQHKPVAVNSQG